MQPACLALALLACLGVVTDATVVLTTGAVTASTAATAAALAGVGALAIAGGLVGAGILASRRGRRAVGPPRRAELLLGIVEAADADECAIKLVCMIAAHGDKLKSKHAKKMLAVATQDAEGETGGVYKAAARLGSEEGHPRCQQEYPTCGYGFEEMMAYVREVTD